MKLYVDYSLLRSDAAPCGTAYLALRQAGHGPDLVYKAGPGSGCAGTGASPPVLLTDDGEVIYPLSRILAWVEGKTENAR
jgi:hypothetical protein